MGAFYFLTYYFCILALPEKYRTCQRAGQNNKKQSIRIVSGKKKEKELSHTFGSMYFLVISFLNLKQVIAFLRYTSNPYNIKLHWKSKHKFAENKQKSVDNITVVKAHKYKVNEAA